MVFTPITETELRTKLNEGTINFAFKKVNGDLRTAIGTTALESIPTENHPVGEGNKSTASVRYFDLAKNDWRSVSSRSEMFIIE